MGRVHASGTGSGIGLSSGGDGAKKTRSQASSEMILQLDPPLAFSTPKGDGLAILVIDYGVDYSLLFVVIIDATGEVWTFRNEQVRGIKNITHGRRT